MNLPEQVEATTGIARLFWRFVTDHGGTRDGDMLAVIGTPASEQAWNALIEESRKSGQLWNNLETELRERDLLFGPESTGTLRLHPAVTQPLRLLSFLRTKPAPLPGDSERRPRPFGPDPPVEDDYFVWQAIRRHWLAQLGAAGSGDIVRSVTASARALTDYLKQQAEVRQRGEPVRNALEITTAAGVAEVRALLRVALTAELAGALSVDAHVEFYLECCRTLRTVVHPYRVPGLWLDPEWLDSDRILSHMVGLRTRIPFFDELFLGGGLAVAASDPNLLGGPDRARRRGRIILIRGRFGTGKTSLALALGAAFGRAGGTALFTPLEQSPDQCLQYMRALGLVARSEDTSAPSPQQAEPGTLASTSTGTDENSSKLDGGSLSIFRRDEADMKALLSAIYGEAQQSTGPRLFILDPLNSVRLTEKVEELRGDMVKGLEQICATGADLLLTAEHDPKVPGPYDMLANIADTVIEISIRAKYDYEQRYLEVLKSRLQREQRGAHPIAIHPGTGLSIALSASAMVARLRTRQDRTAKFVSSFGLPALDELLGKGAMYQGDVIVLVGEAGTYKTFLGFSFLLGSDWQKADVSREKLEERNEEPSDERSNDSRPGLPPSGLTPKSLYISVRDHFAVERTIDEALKILNNQRASQKYIDRLELPSGNVTTAWLLRLLEEKFDEAQAKGEFIDRVMVSNLAHWELSCPYVRDDAVFGDAFSDFVRSRQATLLHICNNDITDSRSTLQRTILDDSNVLLELRRVEYDGGDRVLLRATKTRSMSHSRDAVEVSVQAGGITLDPSLLRLDREGASHKLRLDLFVYGQSKSQKAYYDEVKERLSNILDLPTIGMKTSKDHRAGLVRALQSAPFLSGDGIRILQLDEFEVIQLRDEASGSRALLHSFPKRELGASHEDLKDIDNRLCEHARDPEIPGNLVAVPYYQNIGLLCLAEDQQPNSPTFENWTSIAEACDQHGPDSTPFFWMPTARDEDLNCLFWEIFLSAPQKHVGTRVLPHDGLHTPVFLELEVCNTFRSLCRPLLSRPGVPADVTSKDVGAKVYRLWFSTLWEFAGSEMPPPFHVLPLPGKVSLTGEWYLGIAASSPSLPVGLAVLRDLTSPAADAERYRRRVGLPIRKRFYDDPDPAVSPMQGMLQGGTTIGALLDESYKHRRSAISNYSRLAPIMGVQLRRLCQLGGEGPLGEAEFREWKKLFANSVKLANRAGSPDSTQPPALSGMPPSRSRRRKKS